MPIIEPTSAYGSAPTWLNVIVSICCAGARNVGWCGRATCGGNTAGAVCCAFSDIIPSASLDALDSGESWASCSNFFWGRCTRKIFFFTSPVVGVVSATSSCELKIRCCSFANQSLSLSGRNTCPIELLLTFAKKSWCVVSKKRRDGLLVALIICQAPMPIPTAPNMVPHAIVRSVLIWIFSGKKNWWAKLINLNNDGTNKLELNDSKFNWMSHVWNLVRLIMMNEKQKSFLTNVVMKNRTTPTLSCRFLMLPCLSHLVRRLLLSGKSFVDVHIYDINHLPLLFHLENIFNLNLKNESCI